MYVLINRTYSGLLPEHDVRVDAVCGRSDAQCETPLPGSRRQRHGSHGRAGGLNGWVALGRQERFDDLRRCVFVG